MALLDDSISEQFHRWERAGRGWRVWSRPVAPEPPFRPFVGYVTHSGYHIDDGRRRTALGSFVQRLRQRLSPQPPPVPSPFPLEDEPEPQPLERDDLLELHVALPPDFDPSPEQFASVLIGLSHSREPIGFELIGSSNEIFCQFVAHREDMPSLHRQLQGHFPEAAFVRTQGILAQASQALDETEAAVVEFGLARECLLPLAASRSDVLVRLTAALADLHEGELGLYQVTFQAAHSSWAENWIKAVSDTEGEPLFVNAPELLLQGQRKTSQPLFAAVVRLATRSEQFDRAWGIAREMASALGAFGDPRGNELIPLSNDHYPYDDHMDDVWHRQCRRNGMLLNQAEIIGLVHLPSSDVRTPKFRCLARKTKRAPKFTEQSGALLLGQNEHAGERCPVYLTTGQRVQHMHVIGASGTGKSTFLFNCIRRDIDNREGIAVLDPHGDLIERIVGIIPPDRIEDVVLVDPSDEEFSVGFNILSAHSDLEKNLLASDLVSVFRRLSTSWGEQMEGVLRNAILAFLDSSRGGTLSDLRRFLLEPGFREEFLDTVADADLVYYWRKGFAQLSGNKSIGPVLTRLETFLAPKSIRYMVAQPTNRLDFANILDSGKIFLAKLSQGLMGRENAFLLGSLFVAKFQQLVMGRQAQRAEARRAFYLYIDEFQNFITPSMAEILTGARKYRLGLILAHQELHQLERDREVASAVLSNPYTRIVFRVGDDDARRLAGGFSFFDARDLQNLETGQAICRIEKATQDFNLTVLPPEAVDPNMADAIRTAVITASRRKYTTPRADVEAALVAKLKSEESRQSKERDKSPRVPKDSEETSPFKATKDPAVTSSPTEPPPVEATKPLEKPTEETAKPRIVRAPISPRDLGRGGAQHKTIQERLQTEAHALGFLVTIEGQVENESTRAADLTLQKGDIALAVEITVTTTTDHEFGNVKKCLAAGYPRVAVVSPSATRLKAIAEAVQAGLGSEEAAKVSYLTPDEFIAELRKLAQETTTSAKPPAPKERVTRGYKIRRHGPALTEEERKTKEDIAVKVMAEAMKRKQ